MQYWSLTDPGCVRSSNQDAHVVEQLDKNTLLCVVCDGMGGAKSGDVASSLAVDVFTQEVKYSWKSDMDQEKIDQILKNALKMANFTVYDQHIFSKLLNNSDIYRYPFLRVRCICQHCAFDVVICISLCQYNRGISNYSHTLCK